MNGYDPFDVLRGGDLPLAPDPEFARRLRARLESAARLFEQQPDRTQGVIMSGTDTALAELTRPAPILRSAVVPYLTVADARAAIRWYIDVFDAELVGDPVEMDDGRIGHAELALADGVLYLADEYPEMGLKAPSPQAVSVSLMLTVASTDETLRRARDHGAQVQREPYENYGARNAALVDPFGHRWMLTGPVTGAAVPIQHGDVGYVAVWTPDAQRAATFYGHVLGWAVDPATQMVTNTGQRVGIVSAPEQRTLFCCYAVTDLDGARASILAGGGSVGEVVDFGFGAVLRATDPHGVEFGVYRPASGEPRPLLNGGGHGELSYITYQVPDSTVFKAFYSGLLFWTYEPGRIDDGWGVVGAHPMSGAAGGNASAVTVPMWTVDDIDAAVSRVRGAGGTVIEEPSQQSYGKSALCTDDQGTRFYLGEL
ncbi:MULTISPECIES: VOC family protein [Mycolicibacterium]|uniref:VOC family protein n=1 Tax=Mycolicibacterium austroafricanum TaxID=39687 RepID=A0ABT8H7U4_MYCAO|nr:VOC family protein [Mycolicibacterium austroafricanum]MDN4516839.1 VOC family protein [Mycolicibacterium austroafricanum]